MAGALLAESIGDGIAGIKRRGYRSRQKCCQLRHVESDAPTSRARSARGWRRRTRSCAANVAGFFYLSAVVPARGWREKLERAKGFEPSTPTLATLRLSIWCFRLRVAGRCCWRPAARRPLSAPPPCQHRLSSRETRHKRELSRWRPSRHSHRGCIR